MKLVTKKNAVAFACALLASGCATSPNGQRQSLGSVLKNTFDSEDPCSDKSRNVGLLVGVIAGSALGHALGDGKKGATLVGAGVGALLGGVIGSDVDRRRCELAKVAKAHNLDILMTDITLVAPAATAPSFSTSTPSIIVASSQQTATVKPTEQTTKPAAVGMSFTVFDHGDQFAVGAAAPSANAIKAFADVAQKYSVKADGTDANALQFARERNKKMRILLIGHTDDTGSSQLNADLSEARAQSIARIFSQQGFESSQIYFQGAGEVFPIADNRTEEGRARNRRVEIVDLSDDAAFDAFLASRRPNLAHYRPASPLVVQTAVGVGSQTGKSGAGSAATAGDILKGNAAPRTKTSKEVKDIVANIPDSVPSKTTGGKVAANDSLPAQLSTASLSNLDFGGKPANGQFKVVDIGKPARTNSFSIISSAYAADDAPIGSCATDRPRISNRVKSLESGQGLKTSAYLPGTASASWGGKMNGHLVGLTGVSVLRDGGQPASRPTLLIWKNWVDGSKAKPDLKTTGDVNTYQGDKALLYRVFPAEGPVRCMDMLIANNAPNTAPSSIVVYDFAKTVYQADYSPTIAR